jgi:transcriptional regulator with XRE-family HTH domain
MTSIGDRIRDLRVARGLTQTALSGEGLSAGYVSLIESGKRTPSTAMVKEIAERLGVPVDELVVASPRGCDEARIDVNFARLALSNGSPDEAVRSMERLELVDLDLETAFEAAMVLAEGLQHLGQIERAVEVLETLDRRLCRAGAWLFHAIAATNLALMYGESGDSATGVDIGARAMEEVEAAGLAGTDEHIRLGATYVYALFERGDLLRATRTVEDLIKVADRVGTTRARGSIYWNAAIVAHGRGRVNDALRLTDRAVALLGEESEHRDLYRLRMHYAWLLLHHDEPKPREALEQLDRAETHDTLVGSQLDLGIAATFRGRAHLMLGNVDEAALQAAKAVQLLGASAHVDRVNALLLLGDVGVAQRDPQMARDSFDEARRVLAGMKESRALARLWRELGDSLKEFGDLPEAMSCYDRSLGLVGIKRNPSPSQVPTPRRVRVPS